MTEFKNTTTTTPHILSFLLSLRLCRSTSRTTHNDDDEDEDDNKLSSYIFSSQDLMQRSLSMKADTQKVLPIVLKPILFFIFLTLFLLTFISLQSPRKSFTTTNPQQQEQNNLEKQQRQEQQQRQRQDQQEEDEQLPSDLKIRPGYTTYESYLNKQLNKTLNPKLRQIWTTRDWTRKVTKFSEFFQSLKSRGILSNASNSLCIGARVGQEVAALKRVGVRSSIGIDLVPYPPLVLKGDFHHQPFDDETFDFEFSNVFDHALYPWKFVGEIERTLKKGGVCVLHVLLSKRADKYSANDLYSVKPLEKMFRSSELVEVRSIDGFGLDTEVVFRKIK